MGRRVEQTPANYTLENFRAWNDRSRANLGVDTLDLVQLHCPPTSVYSSDEVFDALDQMVAEGRIAAYGVSVETVDQALTAIARPGVASVQIILNMFRMKPLERAACCCRGRCRHHRPGTARERAAMGRYTRDTKFAANDHRSYNRHGEAFDVGETFAGVGLRDRRRGGGRVLRAGPRRYTQAQLALRWILQQPGVTTVIPGARSAEQALANAATAALPPLSQVELDAIEGLYDKYFRATVHDRW